MVERYLVALYSKQEKEGTRPRDIAKRKLEAGCTDTADDDQQTSY